MLHELAKYARSLTTPLRLQFVISVITMISVIAGGNGRFSGQKGMDYGEYHYPKD